MDGACIRPFDGTDVQSKPVMRPSIDDGDRTRVFDLLLLKRNHILPLAGDLDLAMGDDQAVSVPMVRRTLPWENRQRLRRQSFFPACSYVDDCGGRFIASAVCSSHVFCCQGNSDHGPSQWATRRSQVCRSGRHAQTASVDVLRIYIEKTGRQPDLGRDGDETHRSWWAIGGL